MAAPRRASRGASRNALFLGTRRARASSACTGPSGNNVINIDTFSTTLQRASRRPRALVPSRFEQNWLPKYNTPTQVRRVPRRADAFLGARRGAAPPRRCCMVCFATNAWALARAGADSLFLLPLGQARALSLDTHQNRSSAPSRRRRTPRSSRRRGPSCPRSSYPGSSSTKGA